MENDDDLDEESGQEQLKRLFQEAMATARKLPQQTVMEILLPCLMQWLGGPKALPTPEAPFLTAQRKKLLQLLAHHKDYNRREIAKRLGVEPSSVRDHQRALAKCLGVPRGTRYAILRAARGYGLV
jgi:DNA-binding NarL/FixJ family response regulator